MKNILKTRVYELIVLLLVLFIVFFVLFAVYKNIDGLGNIRTLDQLHPHREGFSGRPNIEYSSYPQGKAMDSKLAMVIDQSQPPTCGKVWGFNGLFCGLGVADHKIDPYYSAPSDMTCEGSGLTKGRGNLCLDAEQHKLLTTRGGNSVYDSVIG